MKNILVITMSCALMAQAHSANKVSDSSLLEITSSIKLDKLEEWIKIRNQVKFMEVNNQNIIYYEPHNRILNQLREDKERLEHKPAQSLSQAIDAFSLSNR